MSILMEQMLSSGDNLKFNISFSETNSHKPDNSWILVKSTKDLKALLLLQSINSLIYSCPYYKADTDYLELIEWMDENQTWPLQKPIIDTFELKKKKFLQEIMDAHWDKIHHDNIS